MKRFFAALILLMPFAAHAASPEDDYFTSRDQYAKEFSDIDTWDESVTAKHDAALKDLLQQLETIVGPLSLKGFAEDKINLDTLASSDEGYGMLDGLAYTSDDQKTKIVVTTDMLLTRWLKDHANWWEGMQNVPQEIDAAIQSDVFYTQAISTDAAVTLYGTIPIVKPATATSAFALLAGESQDVAPMVPDQLFIAVVTGRRVFIVTAPATAKSIPACERIRRDFDKKADKAYAAYNKSNPQDDKLFDAYTQIQQEGSDAFVRCYSDRAARAAFFPAVVKQAQAIADGLPAQ